VMKNMEKIHDNRVKMNTRFSSLILTLPVLSGSAVLYRADKPPLDQK
jgi:hypothetical protein